MKKVNSWMTQLTSSVLIPSWQRPHALSRCLLSLAQQTQLPNEVIVVWQADDGATREVALQLQFQLPYVLQVLHCQEAGVISAENTALRAAIGEIILLCDDDVIVPETWVARHLSFYGDATVGAVGGSANNHFPDGSLFPKRTAEPIGKLTWYGQLHGNMYDHPDIWRARSPIAVDHLVGYNLSLRRAAFNQFETRLKRYWQNFELDVCLQVRQGGYRILFDFANVVNHYPTNTAYAGGREGDLEVKIFNARYNQAFVMAKHSPLHLRWLRFLYPMAIGTVGVPGLLASLVAIKRFGYPRRELDILWRTWRSSWHGWRAGVLSKRGLPQVEETI